MTTDHFFIKKGPSQYDLLMSFFEKKELDFEKESQNRLVSVTKFVVTGLQENKYDSNSYYLQISVISDSSGVIKPRQRYYVVYNYVTRLGHLNLEIEKNSGADNFLFRSDIINCRLDPITKSEISFLINSGYDWMADGIRENITLEFLLDSYREESYPAFLFDFNCHITQKGVIKNMTEHSCLPANCLDLLFFDKKYPEQKKQLPVIALGQSIEYNGETCYLGLSYGYTGTHLGSQLCLIPAVEIFHDHDYYYLAVEPAKY